MILPLSALGTVAWPDLAGDHYFAIFGRHGYVRAVLAPSEASFVAAARRTVFDGGYTKVLHSAQHIRVVSLAPEWVAILRRPHQAAIEEHYARWVLGTAKQYHKAFGEAPAGFVRTARGDVRWRGNEPLSVAFRGKCGQPIADAPSGALPRAEAAIALRDVWAVTKGSWNAEPQACALKGSLEMLLSTQPLFFFVPLADCSRLVDPLLAEEKALREAEAAREPEARNAEDEAHDREERARLLAFFDRGVNTTPSMDVDRTEETGR